MIRTCTVCTHVYMCTHVTYTYMYYACMCTTTYMYHVCIYLLPTYMYYMWGTL